MDRSPDAQQEQKLLYWDTGHFHPLRRTSVSMCSVFCCALKRKTRRGSRRLIDFAHGCISAAFPWLYWTSAVQLMWDECSFKGGFYPAQWGERERERERERECLGLEGRDLSPSPVSASVSGNLANRKHHLYSHEPAGNCHLEFTAIQIWTSSINIRYILNYLTIYIYIYSALH